MNTKPQKTADEFNFSVAEHLEVQRRIEALAYVKWIESGCQTATADNWIEAEEEVMTDFCRRRLNQAKSAAPPVASKAK